MTDDEVDKRWLLERCEFEELEASRIAVEASPRKWHSELIFMRERVQSALKGLNVRQIELAAERIRSLKAKRAKISWEDIRVLRDGGLLFARNNPVAIGVTSVTVNRALAVANAIFLAADARGCTLGFDEDRGRFTLQLEDATFYIAIRERQDSTVVKSTDSKYTTEYKVFLPTDRLAITIERYPESRFELLDSATKRVEMRLNSLFVRLYESVISMRAKARDRKMADEQRAIANLAYQEITRQREIEAKVKAAEQLRRSELIAEVSAWHQAQQIRAFVAHIQAQASTEAESWASWASGVADSLDPTEGLLKRIQPS